MGQQMEKWRTTRIAVIAAAMAISLGSIAWGSPTPQYDNGRYYDQHDQARDLGSRNGYRDGLRAGQIDVQRGRRFNFKNDDWEDSRGYEHWMGSKRDYKHEYREAYERGYRDGYNGRRAWDRDHHDRDDWR